MASRLFCNRAFSQFKLLNLSKTANRSYATDMSFTFASPKEVFYNKSSSVKQVDVPSYSGSFGILPHHVPTLAVLKPGVVTIHEEEGETKKFFVSSGSITINDDSSVQLLAQEAVPVDRLDSQACKDGLTKAQQALSSATTEIDKAEAQIAIEAHEELIKATS